MIFRLGKRILFGRKKNKANQNQNQKKPERTRKTGNETAVIKPNIVPDWEIVLTSSLKDTCLAPSEEVILHAYDLHCEALFEPHREREREILRARAKVFSGLAELRAIAPDLVERVMTRHQLEFHRHIESEGENR
jgi:hypothetical protein